MIRKRVCGLTMRSLAIFTSTTIVGLLLFLILFGDSSMHEHLRTRTETDKDSLTHMETDSFNQAYRDSMVIENCKAEFTSNGSMTGNLTTKLKGPLSSAFGFLTPDSFVIGVGGFKGSEDTGHIIENYDPWMVIFEPMPNYAEELRMKFRTRPKIFVVQVGLHDVDTSTFFTNRADGTSFFYKENQTGMPVKLRNGTRIFEKLGVNLHQVDLLQVDCEGCEFNLIEELIRLKWVRNVRYIYLEVHSIFSGVKDPDLRYCKIRAELANTHINLSHRSGHPEKKIWIDIWALKEVNTLYYLPRNISGIMTDLET